MDTGNRLEIAVDIAREAGDLLLRMAGEGAGGRVDYKGRRDLVTAADRASEDLITTRLLEAFPDDTIAAEEGGRRHEGASGFTWYVDPLDGTTNYAHAHPFYAVSLGCAVDDVPVLGAVRAPRLGETFAGEVGVGATRDGTPIHVSETDELIRSLVATGFAYNRNEVPDNNLDHFGRVLLEVQGMRRAGAASLELCLVAAGVLDAFWELYLAPWDVAAGAAIVRAAGGEVTDARGGGDFVHGNTIVATNGRLHDALRAILSEGRCPGDGAPRSS
jgi:myo-inositol-1(or 4)-monophosphatase